MRLYRPTKQMNLEIWLVILYVPKQERVEIEMKQTSGISKWKRLEDQFTWISRKLDLT